MDLQRSAVEEGPQVAQPGSRGTLWPFVGQQWMGDMQLPLFPCLSPLSLSGPESGAHSLPGMTP